MSILLTLLLCVLSSFTLLWILFDIVSDNISVDKITSFEEPSELLDDFQSYIFV